jgi:hypothetical protein
MINTPYIRHIKFDSILLRNVRWYKVGHLASMFPSPQSHDGSVSKHSVCQNPWPVWIWIPTVDTRTSLLLIVLWVSASPTLASNNLTGLSIFIQCLPPENPRRQPLRHPRRVSSTSYNAPGYKQRTRLFSLYRRKMRERC